MDVQQARSTGMKRTPFLRLLDQRFKQKRPKATAQCGDDDDDTHTHLLCDLLANELDARFEFLL